MLQYYTSELLGLRQKHISFLNASIFLEFEAIGSLSLGYSNLNMTT